MKGKYRCLRDCFVASRLFLRDGVYDLTDDIPKDPKNFEPLEQPEPTPALEPIVELGSGKESAPVPVAEESVSPAPAPKGSKKKTKK